MELPISLFIFGLFFAATAYMAIVTALRVRRQGKTDFKEVVHRADNMLATMKKLPELEGKERLAACRTIAEDMRFHSNVLMHMVWGTHTKYPDEKSEIGKLTLAVMRKAAVLNSELSCFIFQLRYRPSRVRDCRRRLRRAVVQWFRMWEAFVRLLRVLYPDDFKGLPELAD